MPSRSKDEVELGDKRIGLLFLLKWNSGEIVVYNLAKSQCDITQDMQPRNHLKDR